MAYPRVMPRDLFNEGNLLTCLGRLWIKLDERRDHVARLWNDESLPFRITQDQSDGSISCETAWFTIGEHGYVRLFRPLNARAKWPLYASIGGEDVRVFDLDGELSPEFWIAITDG